MSKGWMILLLLGTSCDNGKPALPPPTTDLGTGLNAVERRYPKLVPEVLAAASAALKDLGLQADTEKGDALGGEILAHRATDDKVQVTVKAVDAFGTSVSIRVAPGDRHMSAMIHEKIAAALGLARTAGPGEQVTQSYLENLMTCVHAAEKAFKSLKYDIVDRRGGEEEAELFARSEDSSPASFLFRKTIEGKTQVTIRSGTEPGSASQERRDHLKSSFEAALAGEKKK